MAKSLILAYTYLPHNLPFVSQIVNAFQKLHSLNKEEINEDDEYEEDIA